MKQIYKVAYLGFSPEMVLYLGQHPNFKIQVAICEQSRFTNAYAQASVHVHCPYICLDKYTGLQQIVSQFSQEIDFFIIYKTSLIIKPELLEQYHFYNFHPGDLSENKGAHPLAWTLLLDKPMGTLSLHEIDEKIDEGILIDTYQVETYLSDDPLILEKRLEKGIPKLLGSLCRFLNGELAGQPVKPGGYRRKIKPEDYTIDAENDTMRMVIRKIQSQKLYQGAIFRNAPTGKTFSVAGYRICSGKPTVLKTDEIYLKKQGIILAGVQEMQ